MSEATSAKHYTGLRVIDFTTTIAGPHCTRLLADLGADVIKVETAEGDMMRTRPPLRNGASAMFGQLNSGKRSIVLDLKQAEARDALSRLLAGADILVENYRPGVTARLGIDYETLAASCPGLIYCSISGYGQTGPSADKAAYAPVIHADSGFDLAHLAFQPGRDRPDYCGIFIADVLAGTYAFGAIGAALQARGQTGQGQHIDVSMLESMLSLTLVEMQAAQFEMPPAPSRPLFGPLETSDGHISVTIASERTWIGACRAAGRLDWMEDPRFKVYLTRRMNWGPLMDEFENWSRALTTAEALARLDENGVPAAAYRTVADVLADPQIAHREALATVVDAGGSFQALNLPFRMSGTSTVTGHHAPALGEHTRDILTELGLDPSKAR